MFMGASVTGKKRYYKEDTCKYFYEGEQPDGWVLGTPSSTKEKASNSIKNLWKSEKYRSNQIDVRNTGEYHNKISNISKESWEQSREQRVLSLSKAAYKRFENSDERIACSDRMKKKWEDSEYREKQSFRLKESHANIYKNHPEYKYVLSSSNSKTWKEKKRDILDKQYVTKSKNNSWNTSKLEEEYYEFLLTKYNKDDIVRQYSSDERYPFNCDFYIKSEDRFIEIQGTWTHGGHPFDKNNPDDIIKLNEWVEKSKTSSYYKSAIKVWTCTDVIKRNTAKKNNINIEFIY